MQTIWSILFWLLLAACLYFVVYKRLIKDRYWGKKKSRIV